MTILTIKEHLQKGQMSRTAKLDVKTALEQVQQHEMEMDVTEAENILIRELSAIWTRIQNSPDSYTMDQTEFAIFNRYRADARLQNEIARQAIARYWNSKTIANSH